jgi:hypothetical protein
VAAAGALHATNARRERITHTCSHHSKGVHGFVWCPTYSCFASCGLERDVVVWHVSSASCAPSS